MDAHKGADVMVLPGMGAPFSSASFTATLNDWLVSQALDDVEVGEVLEGLIVRLVAAGVPLQRVFIGFLTLHPLYEGISYRWDAGHETVERTTYLSVGSKSNDSDAWDRSPFKWMLDHGVTSLRRHLIGPGALRDFPVLEEFREAGGTDYLVQITPFVTDADSQAGRNRIMVTYLTNRPSGFTDEDLAILSGIQRSLTVALKTRVAHEETNTILSTYLGPNAGRRVRNGQIKRGDGDATHSVIWFSDLRNSTKLADSLSEEAFLAELNAYFEATAEAVVEHGGEVLRFMGDAVLAIFPVGEDGYDEGEACRRALEAAYDAENRVEAANHQRAQNGAPPLDFGLGLHVGKVLYGNVGIPERLEFTVIGAAANEAARIEALTKTLGRRVLMSCAFACHIDAPLVDFGEQDLRGVGVRHRIFALESGAARKMRKIG